VARILRRMQGRRCRASASTRTGWARPFALTRAIRASALALVLLLLCVAGASAQNAAGRLEISHLEFDGNRAFPDDSLAFAIVNRETACHLPLGLFCWEALDPADRKEYLIRRELDRDVLRLRGYYWERGYRDARVDTAVAYNAERPATSITFQIQEGDPVRVDSLAFVGTDVMDEDQLLRSLPVAVGDPLSIIRLEMTRDSLVRRLKNDGYFRAEVFLQRFIPEGRPHAAQVTYEIDAGTRARIGELNIQTTGDAALDEEVVRRLLPFSEGSLYSEADIEQGQRNLYSLELVNNALIAPDTARMVALPDSLVALTIVVGTSTLHRVRVGAGWNMADCINAEARWANRNVFGSAQVLSITGRLSNLLAEEMHGNGCRYAGVNEFGGLNWALSTDLTFPWIISPRNSLGLSVFWERQSVPDVFIREAVGFNVIVSRIFRPRTPLSVYYRPQRTGLEAAGIFFCISLLVCAPEDIEVLQDPNWLAPVGIVMTRDRTDDLLNPSNGYSARIEVEHADRITASDFQYTRLTGDMSRYWGLARRTIFALRLRGGWVGNAEFRQVVSSGGNVVNPQKRFFAGGANSVRGFPQNGLGPRVLTADIGDLLGPVQIQSGDTILTGPCMPEELEAFTCDAGTLRVDQLFPRPTGGTRLLEGSLEYRFAVSGEFQGVTFVDFGQVWSEREALDLGGLEWTPGVGARYFSPIGPLRLDIAYRFRGSEQLPLVTSRVRPFRSGDLLTDRICLPVEGSQRPVTDLACVDAEGRPIENRLSIPWVRRDELALLEPLVRFGEDRGFFNRLQIHLSIGQAF
jgi:outer membrane protein assembly complex protein YaeT